MTPKNLHFSYGTRFGGTAQLAVVHAFLIQIPTYIKEGVTGGNRHYPTDLQQIFGDPMGMIRGFLIPYMGVTCRLGCFGVALYCDQECQRC